MALVDYASSSDEEEEEEDEDEDAAQSLLNTNTAATLKRKRHEEEETSELPPPLPSKFHDLYASTTRVSTRDDPTLHGGRTRISPHVEGNWPTHLYIEWYPSTIENGSLTELISKLEKSIILNEVNINSFLTSDLGAPLPLHISLSRPIGFSTEIKDAFVTSLIVSVKSSGIRPFNVTFSTLDWVPNFEKTRWFLVLRLQEPQLNGFNKLLYVSNKVVQEFGQPTLYASLPESSRRVTKSKRKGSSNERERSGSKMDWSGMQGVSDAFHVSIAWTLEPPSPELLDVTKSMAIEGFEGVKRISFRVEEMKAKVGNVVTSISLPRKVVEGKSLWGE